MVTSDSGTMYAGSRFRNYIYADGAGADFIAKYATKSMQYVLNYSDGGKITFNHLAAAVALFNVSEPADPGDKPSRCPPTSSTAATGWPTRSKPSTARTTRLSPRRLRAASLRTLAWEAWDLMSEWQRTEATPAPRASFS